MASLEFDKLRAEGDPSAASSRRLAGTDYFVYFPGKYLYINRLVASFPVGTGFGHRFSSR